VNFAEFEMFEMHRKRVRFVIQNAEDSRKYKLKYRTDITSPDWLRLQIRPLCHCKMLQLLNKSWSCALKPSRIILSSQ